MLLGFWPWLNRDAQDSRRRRRDEALAQRACSAGTGSKAALQSVMKIQGDSALAAIVTNPDVRLEVAVEALARIKDRRQAGSVASRLAKRDPSFLKTTSDEWVLASCAGFLGQDRKEELLSKVDSTAVLLELMKHIGDEPLLTNIVEKMTSSVTDMDELAHLVTCITINFWYRTTNFGCNDFLQVVIICCFRWLDF